MGKEKPVELSLELGEGACRVMVDGLALNISLKGPLGGVPSAPPARLPEATPLPQLPPGNGAESQRLLEELDYYRQISHDIYDELGQLAKKLNVSLQDLTVADVVSSQIDSPGEHLDQARIQVNDVLEMTERATLNILDLVEQIREDCESVRQQIIRLSAHEDEWAAPPTPGGWGEETRTLMAEILAQGEELNRQFQVPAAAPPTAPAEAGSSLHFPLGEVLQIVLEFCGNEALKQHLKAVIAKQGEIFSTPEVEGAIAQLAATQPEEDGFSQLPVEEILKILQGACKENRFKDLFNKMLASAGKLFPMPVLPLEGHPVDAAAAPAPAPAAPQKPDFLPLWEDFFQKVQKLAAQAEAPPEVPAPMETPVEAEEVQETIGVLDRMTSSLSRIMELLSFQDLSGQRLLQVLKLLRQIQLQILTMVVAAGTKLKKKSEQRGLTLEESGAMAQDEIDRLMVTVTPAVSSSEPPTEAEQAQVLDQDAINDLLTNMGF
jgi:chemotaxis regulatin CheY-phosphate phosphatase CheZ